VYVKGRGGGRERRQSVCASNQVRESETERGGGTRGREGKGGKEREKKRKRYKERLR